LRKHVTKKVKVSEYVARVTEWPFNTIIIVVLVLVHYFQAQ